MFAKSNRSQALPGVSTASPSPISATSSKEFVIQHDGQNFVNVLVYEYEETANGFFEANHLTGTLRQWGRVPNFPSDGGTLDFPTSFADTSYSITATVDTAATSNRRIVEFTSNRTPNDIGARVFLASNSNGSSNGFSWQAEGKLPTS